MHLINKKCVTLVLQSAVGGGKKKKGKTIKQVRENDFDEGEYDEFDDFMWHEFIRLISYLPHQTNAAALCGMKMICWDHR